VFLKGKYCGKFLDEKRAKKVNLKLGRIEELRGLFGEANIIEIMKCSRLRWTGHV